MKKYIFLLLLPLIGFISCDDDDDGYSLGNYRVDIATVENPDKDAYFFLVRDNGIRLWVGATNYPNYRPQTGQRVLVDYTLLSDRPEGSNYDHDVRLNDAYNILTKDVEILSEGETDMFGNDKIGIHNMWIGSNYLNIRFYYQGYNKTHYINLVWDETKTYTDGKIHLELRHDANNDAINRTYNGMVSFDLDSLTDELTVNSSSLELVIHVNNFNENNKEYSFTYKINENNYSSVDFDRDDYSENEDNNVR